MLVKELKKIPLFSKFPRTALVTLSKLVKVEDYDDNQLIFKEGKTRDRLIVVLEGRVVIEKEMLNRQEPLAVFKPYDVLGETIIYSPGAKHNHTGKSFSPDTKILSITIYNLLRLFKAHPQTSTLVHQYFVEVLSKRLYRSNEKLLTLFATSKLAITFQNKEHLVESLLDNLLKLFKVKKALVALYDTTTRRIIIEKHLGYGRTKMPKNLQLEADTVLSKVLSKQESIIISSKNWEKQYGSMPYAEKNMLLVPIMTKNKIVGCIALAEKTNRKPFSLNNQLLLEAIAEQVSPGLAELEREQTEKNLASLKNTYIDPFYT